MWEGLIDAFNAGDASALERTIGTGPLSGQGFWWVSFADGMGRDTEYTADGARRMLLERWSRGQRLTLVAVEAGAGPSWHGGVDASVRLESRAPGLTRTASILGKTVVSCLGARLCSQPRGRVTFAPQHSGDPPDVPIRTSRAAHLA